jgi:hypothetical protein
MIILLITWKGYRKQAIVLNLRHYSGIFLERLRRITATSVEIADLLAEV